MTRIAAGLLLGLALAACTAGAPVSQVERPASSAVALGATPTATHTAVPTTSAIDLRGVDACASAPAEILAAVGLDPASAEDRSNRLARACRWTSAGRASSLQVVLRADIDLSILAESSPQVFKEYVLDGYPAVREAMEGSFLCTIYVQVAPGQGISVDFGTTADVSPESVCPTTERLALDLMRAIARAE